MGKLYTRILILFLLFIAVLNAASFTAGLDKKQIYNFFFFSERAGAVYYLAKHVILESGVYLKNTAQLQLEESIQSAAAAYGVEPQMLRAVIKSASEFHISVNGGMGLTAVTPSQFRASGLTDPYDFNENILAAAFIIKNIADSGTAQDDILKEFLFAGTPPETMKILMPQYYTYIGTLAAK